MERLLFRAAPLLALALLVSPAFAINILSPNDFNIPIDADPYGGVLNNDYPGGEPPANVADGTVTKYLNFAGRGSGFIITPDQPGATTVQSIRFTSANDAEGRDPYVFALYGTNEAIVSPDKSDGLSENWTLIDSFRLNGPYLLPDANNRDTPGAVVPISNSASYTSYKMLFPVLKGVNDLFQVGEVEFFESADGSTANILSLNEAEDNVRGIAYRSSDSRFPIGEDTPNLLDNNAGTKYLNFSKENAGVIITPASGPQVVTSFQITTANDAPERDPASYEIFGTNDPITSVANSTGVEENWTPLGSGSLALPDERAALSETVSIPNGNAYSSYKIIFPTLKQTANANSLQIAGLRLNTTDPAELKIDRQTGQVSIESTETLSIGSYEIVSSTFGTLLADNWDSIASTNGDPGDTWQETSSTEDLLAEGDTVGGDDDGFELSPGSPLALGDILPILASQFEDITFNLYAPDGSLIAQRVNYDGLAIPTGDFSGNGSVGIEDWPAFAAVYGSVIPDDASPLDAYLSGDFDGDYDSDIHDFNIFVEAAGGMAALFGGTQVPEPSGLAILATAAIGTVLIRKRKQIASLVVAVGFAMVFLCGNSSAQSFSLATSSIPTTTIPEGQMNEEVANEDTDPSALFDDPFISNLSIDGDLFAVDYAATPIKDPDAGTPYFQYRGAGGDPKIVFMDYGQEVSANWFAYAQRSGQITTADRMGTFEFWFNTNAEGDFGGVLPETEPDAVVNILPTDNRLRDSVLRPYTLSGDHTGQYVAMRMTLSQLSAESSWVNNPGGHEFRLLQGPSDVVLEVDRASGEMTLKNDLAGAINIEMKSYTISSPAGALDPVEFNGLGDDTGFTDWTIGGGSNAERLVEASFTSPTSSTLLTAGQTGLSLGDAFNGNLMTEDLVFTWTNPAGELYDARVVYTGDFPDILTGDYNDDGTVNLADYVVWRNNLGSTLGLPNDPTPAIVDQDDYTRWKDNFGAMTPPLVGAVTSVPEPSAIWLGLAAVAAKFAYRRSQRMA